MKLANFTFQGLGIGFYDWREMIQLLQLRDSMSLLHSETTWKSYSFYCEGIKASLLKINLAVIRNLGPVDFIALKIRVFFIIPTRTFSLKILSIMIMIQPFLRSLQFNICLKVKLAQGFIKICSIFQICCFAIALSSYSMLLYSFND